ncbi:MAG: PEGA domain-containing protein [Kofleriaceae bacterium]|nr:PEGA domain-containing protein [Kofleriaceae bacterium]
MLTRQIVVVSPAPDVRAYLANALEIAGCRLEVVSGPEALSAGLITDTLSVVFAEDERTVTGLLPRLRGTARVIVVLPQPSLAASIAWLAISDRVSAVVALEGLEPAVLNRIATRILEGASVSLDDERSADTTVQTYVIDGERMKHECLARLNDYVGKIGVPARLRTSIEQACDELVTNALYAAPVDADGRRVFGELTSAERTRFKIAAQVTVRFAGNARRFAMSVRDEFGSMSREIPLRFLEKGVHATEKVDRKIAGAGLGLYLLASTSAAVHFHLEYGIATEITCAFDLAAADPMLQQISLHCAQGELSEVAARAQARDVQLRRVRTPITLRTWLMGGAITALVTTVAIGVGWRVMNARPETLALSVTSSPPGAKLTVDGVSLAGTTIAGIRPGRPILIAAELRGHVSQRVVVNPRVDGEAVTITLPRQSALVDIDSIPPGATALVDGKQVGETPVVVPNLMPGRQVTITLQRPGFAEATVRTVVPPLGGRSELREQLSPAPGYASVHIDSTPPGARIIDPSGALGEVAKFTPADLVLSTKEEHTFGLAMPHHLPATLPPFRAETGLSRSAALEEVPEIQIESDHPGTATVTGVPHCAVVDLPGACPVSPGSYEVELRAAGQPTKRRMVSVTTEDVLIRY